MREIKFRAWDLKNKKIIPVAMNCVYRNRHSLHGDIYIYQAEPFGESVRIELMQFTGLKDSNGKEIYEGDIVEFSDRLTKIRDALGVVGFKNGSFIIYSGAITHYRWIDYDVEVIGNTYENHSLLEEE